MYIYLTKRQAFLCKFLGFHSSVSEGPCVLGCDSTLLLSSLTLKKVMYCLHSQASSGPKHFFYMFVRHS